MAPTTNGATRQTSQTDLPRQDAQRDREEHQRQQGLGQLGHAALDQKLQGVDVRGHPGDQLPRRRAVEECGRHREDMAEQPVAQPSHEPLTGA